MIKVSYFEIKFIIKDFFSFRLSQGKQNKIYLPEEPFPHAHLVRTGRLKPFKHIYDDGFCNDMRQVSAEQIII